MCSRRITSLSFSTLHGHFYQLTRHYSLHRSRIDICRVLSKTNKLSFHSYRNVIFRNGIYGKRVMIFGLGSMFFATIQIALSESIMNEKKKSDADAETTDVTIQYMSQPRYGIPEYPGLIRVVADTIEEVILDQDTDALFAIWESESEAAGLLAPVYYQVAYALYGLRTLKVAKMNLKGNHKNGFTNLTIQKTPTLKFYPAGKKENPISFQGIQNSENIIKFIHKHATYSFDLDYALQRSERLNPMTAHRLSGFLKKNPIRPITLTSPCGPQEWGHFEASILEKYIPSEKHARWLSLMKTAEEKCFMKKRSAIYFYWADVQKMTESNLDPN